MIVRSWYSDIEQSSWYSDIELEKCLSPMQAKLDAAWEMQHATPEIYDSIKPEVVTRFLDLLRYSPKACSRVKGVLRKVGHFWEHVIFGRMRIRRARAGGPPPPVGDYDTDVCLLHEIAS